MYSHFGNPPMLSRESVSEKASTPRVIKSTPTNAIPIQKLIGSLLMTNNQTINGKSIALIVCVLCSK